MNASEARNKHCMTYFISMSSCQTKIVKMSTSYTDKSAIKLLHDENKCNGEKTCKMLHAQHVALRVSSLYLTQQVRRISCIFRSCIFWSSIFSVPPPPPKKLQELHHLWALQQTVHRHHASFLISWKKYSMQQTQWLYQSCHLRD